MNQGDWFDQWDPQQLYQSKVVNCDDASSTSPVGSSGELICGPLLRLIGVDYSNNEYRGSMMIVSTNASSPVVKYLTGPSSSEIAEPLTKGEFQVKLFYKEKNYYFYRYNIIFPLTLFEQMVKYSVNGSFEPHYRFFIPSKTTNFNTISFSCNGFSLSVDTTKFKGSLWFDILKKHEKIHYHVMLGGGDQIYSDGIKLYCNAFKKWLGTKDPISKYSQKLTPEFSAELDNFYLNEYLEWYGYGYWKGSKPESKTTQRCFPIAMSTIPSINIFDDHDIIDGFGSYSHNFMNTEIFSGVGKAAYKYYMIFQHHVSIDEQDAYLDDPVWVLGANKGEYIGEKSHSVFSRLGPSMGVLGLDCRTERKLKEICSEKTYDIVFERLRHEVETQKLDHLLLMLGVPIAYPRLVWLEWLFSSKFLAPLKYLSKKGFISRGLVNEFNGDVEVLDDLNDHWCARHHKKERNYLVAQLQNFGAKHGIRITILSGDVHLAAIGRFKSKIHTHHLTSSHESENENVLAHPETDVRLMFNVVSSAVVNTPPPDAMAKLLQKRSRIHHFDARTDEDVLNIFETDVDGQKRSNSAFMNRRNWSDIIPVQNALNNKYLRELLQFELGSKVAPGIVGKHGNTQTPADNSKGSVEKMAETYPVTADGVIATIHVEADAMSISSETAHYAVVIPELQATAENLSHAGIKHLDL